MHRQQNVEDRSRKTILAGKVILIAGLILFAYSSYATILEQLGFLSCPQFRGGSVIIGWCGQSSLLLTYLIKSMVVIVLGTSLFMWASHSKKSTRDRATLAVQIFLALIAISLISLQTLMILNNFHVDFYG